MAEGPRQNTRERPIFKSTKKEYIWKIRRNIQGNKRKDLKKKKKKSCLIGVSTVEVLKVQPRADDVSTEEVPQRAVGQETGGRFRSDPAGVMRQPGSRTPESSSFSRAPHGLMATLLGTRFLLDDQSTHSLFCGPAFCSRTLS